MAYQDVNRIDYEQDETGRQSNGRDHETRHGNERIFAGMHQQQGESRVVTEIRRYLDTVKRSPQQEVQTNS